MFHFSCSDCEFYDGDEAFPVYEFLPSNRRRLYSAVDIIHILLNPEMQHSKVVCSNVPTSIHRNVTFVVDTSKLENRSDILADDMGVWINNGVDTTYFTLSMGDKKIKAVKQASPSTPSASFHIVKRVYRIHGTNRSLRKLTAYVQCKLNSRIYFMYLKL